MLLATLLFVAAVNAIPRPAPLLFVNEVRMRTGDDVAWSRPAFDDSAWTRVDLVDVPQRDDTVWLRARVDLTKVERRPGRPLAIYFGGLASHELWWDGERIGGGGIVARTKEREIPGPIESHYQIPDRLATPAEHIISLRVSAFHRGFAPRQGYWTLLVADYDRIVALRTSNGRRSMIALSGILLTAVFAFAMHWLASRDRFFLLLGTLCLSAAALLLAEASRELWGYTYDWHIVRLRCIVVLSWLVGVQLVALLVTRFPHRHGRTVLAASAAYATIVPFVMPFWDSKSLAIFIGCCSVAAGWALFAALRRLRGSMLALAGTGVLLVALMIEPYSWVDHVLYFALDFLFLCLLCSHALEVRHERQEKERLRIEILRRHMQPHFLMNTLTALSEWIEQEPRTAVRMIDSLAEELRILGEMSTKTLVTVADELRLCRSHLANMSLRKNVVYALEIHDVDDARLVPPALFHTLVENAITHGGSAPNVTLHLRQEGSRYVFESPLDPDDDREPRPGSGTRYIEARLREAFGSGWRFHQARAGDVWRAVIEVTS